MRRLLVVAVVAGALIAAPAAGAAVNSSIGAAHVFRAAAVKDCRAQQTNPLAGCGWGWTRCDRSYHYVELGTGRLTGRYYECVVQVWAYVTGLNGRWCNWFGTVEPSGAVNREDVWTCKAR